MWGVNEIRSGYLLPIQDQEAYGTSVVASQPETEVYIVEEKLTI